MDITTRVYIRAAEGHTLTNGRVCMKSVVLSDPEDIGKWTEIEEQKYEWNASLAATPAEEAPAEETAETQVDAMTEEVTEEAPSEAPAGEEDGSV